MGGKARDRDSDMGVGVRGVTTSGRRGGGQAPALLCSQLPMVSAAAVSGDGSDERGAPAAALHLPRVCQ